MIKKTTLLLIFLLTIRASLFSQYYLTGQDPASTRWKQIKNKTVHLVFPDGYDSIAHYYANVIELSGKYTAMPYLHHVRPVTVVLHNQTTVSNAMVSPAPFHADFFEMPSQEMYPQRWQDQLSLHEYRHVVQMEKMYQGFTKGLYYLLGQQGVAAIFGTFLPFWFIEGDAVLNETIHSKSGRGRVPDFTTKLKAQILEKKIYPYDKALFGSYNDFVPDHYTLGYQLVTEGVKKYGNTLWNDMLNRVARKAYTLRPFTRSLKKTTGYGKVGFYNQILRHLQVQWKKTQQPVQESSITIHNKFYTDYLFPHLLSDGSIICEKSGKDDINRFVRIFPDGKEELLFTPGYDFKESLSANDSLICWNEKGFDPRWSNRNYSVIKIYNFKTKQLLKISRKSRFFAPALSRDGTRIATVEVNNRGRSRLLILNAKTGKAIRSYKNDTLFIMTPRWANTDTAIVFTALGKKGKILLLYNLLTGQAKPITPFTFAEIKHPVLYDPYVLFSGTFTGKDVLYALHYSSGRLYTVKEPAYAAVWPSVSQEGKTVVYSTYTADGYRPATLKLNPEKFVPVPSAFAAADYPVDDLLNDSTFVLDEVQVPDSIFPVKKYNRLTHLFNLYSWGPFYLDADNYEIQPGITLLSQNKLSTAVSRLSYLFDRNEQTGKTLFGFDYYGWYPVIGIETSYGDRRQYITDEYGTQQEVRWSETNLSASVSVPLNLTSGKWIQGLHPSLTMHQRFLKMNASSSYSFKHDRVTIASVRFFAYRQLKRSPKDIFPRWGFQIDGRYTTTLFDDTASQQASLQASFYIPGILKHQGIRLYTGIQQQHKGYYHFNDDVLLPRGFNALQYPNSWVIKADYAFPIAYPDWDVPSVFYLTRIYSRIFYDHLYDLEQNRWDDHSSAGIELYSDWHFLSLFPEVELGVRYSQPVNQKKGTFDFLFSMSF